MHLVRDWGMILPAAWLEITVLFIVGVWAGIAIWRRMSTEVGEALDET